MTTVTTSILLATASALAATAALAADDVNSGAGAADNSLQEIVVTAQRREQSVLSVPMSIQAMSGSELKNTGITNLTDLQFTVPGLVPSNGFGYTQQYIRGVGNNIYVGADPSVATYIDDVPRIFGTMVTNFVNVDRVEVLKGAQGGLYGRNATGGVVNIITKQPSDTFDAEGRLSYGEKNTQEFGGYLNVPLNDKIAWNLSVERDAHNPYVKDVATPQPYSAANFPTGSAVGTPAQTAAFFNSVAKPPPGLDNEDFVGVDSNLRVRINDDLKVTFSGDFNHKADSSSAGVVNLTPGTLQGLAQGLFTSFGINANLPPGFVETTNQKFATTYGLNGANVDLTDYGGAATAIWNLPGVDITSINAFRAQHSFYYADGAYDNPPIIPEQVDIHKKYVYEELRAASNGDGPIHFLGGATFLHDTLDGHTEISYLPPFPGGAPTVVTDKVTNWTVYGEGGYDITNELNVTASGRYIHETNTAEFTSPEVSGTSSTETKFLPSGTVSYKLNGGNVYFRFAEGFKAGGVNPVVAPSSFPTDFGKIFGPEEVKTYEVGYRGALLDRSVQLTTAIFYNDYKDLQTFTTGNAENTQIVEAIINSGTARSYGVDASVTWRVIAPLTVGVNFTYLNAKYTHFANSDDTVLNTFNYSGQQMIYAPQWQGGPTVDLDLPITSNYRLIGSVLSTFTSKDVLFLSSLPSLPNPTQGAFWLTNLRLGIRTSDDKYEVAVYDRNAFNKGYYTVGNESGLGNTFGWGDPRIIGGEVLFKF